MTDWQAIQVPVKLDHWSHSADQSWRRCPLQWYRRSVLKLTPRVTKHQLSLGTAVHHSLQHFYSLPPADRTSDMLMQRFEAAMQHQRVDIQQYGSEVDRSEFEDSLDRGRLTISTLWKIKGKDEEIPQCQTEVGADITIPGTGGTPFRFRVDGLYLRGDNFLLENKTTARRTQESLEQFDTQTLRYLWALQQMGHQVTDVIWNVITVAGRSTRGGLTRVRVRPTVSEINWAVADMPYIVNDIQRPDRLITTSWNDTCTWGCEFYKLCLTERLGGDASHILAEHFKQRDSQAEPAAPDVDG